MGNRRDYRHICTIGCNDSTLCKLVPRAARPVRSYRDIMSVTKRFGEPYESATRPAGSRSPYQRISHSLQYARDDLPIAVLAHKHGDALVAMKP
jgi:hypothetical protein